MGPAIPVRRFLFRTSGTTMRPSPRGTGPLKDGLRGTTPALKSSSDTSWEHKRRDQRAECGGERQSMADRRHLHRIADEHPIGTQYVQRFTSRARAGATRNDRRTGPSVVRVDAAVLTASRTPDSRRIAPTPPPDANERFLDVGHTQGLDRVREQARTDDGHPATNARFMDSARR
jgi:hypothetical protein